MGKCRRVAALGLSLLVAGGLTTAPALAEPEAAAGAGGTPETYAAEARAEALKIVLFGNVITGSDALASLVSAPKASAEVGEVLLGPVATGGAEAEAVRNGQSIVNEATSCVGSELTAIPGIGRLDITCGVAEAGVVGGLPSARALGAEVVVDVSLSELLSTLQLQEPANQVVDGTYEQVINPVVEGLAGTPVGELVDSTTATLQDVLKGALNLDTTTRIVIAPALAEVETTATDVVAHGQAQGIRIEILPLDGVNDTNNLLPDDLAPGEPLITITVGEAEATTIVDRATYTKKGEALASLVTIDFGTTALFQLLGLSDDETGTIRVEAGQTICILEGTPLESCVTVAHAGTDADGNAFADSTSVRLFKGLQEPDAFAVDLTLGRVGSASDGTLPVLPTPLPEAELPRTGGTPFVPLAGAALLALALGARRLATARQR